MNRFQLTYNDKFKFVLIGSINTLIAFALFTALVFLFRPGFQVLYVLVVSSGISYVSGFFLYKNFVWKESAASVEQFIRFVKANLLFLALNLMSLHVFVNGLDFEPIAVQLFTTGVLVVVSFLIHDRWTFDPQLDVLKDTEINGVESDY